MTQDQAVSILLVLAGVPDEIILPLPDSDVGVIQIGSLRALLWPIAYPEGR